MRSSSEIAEILKLHEEGKSYNEIAKLKHTSKSIIAFYCKKQNNINYLEHVKETENAQIEYEHIICDLIKESENINQVCKKLNKRATNNNYKKIQDIIEKYNIDISHFNATNSQTNKSIKYTDQEIFRNNGRVYNTNLLKKRLFNNDHKEYKCEKCGLDSWLGENIVLQIHHINGNRYDNTLENLLILCPNCHSQTNNFCSSKNKKILHDDVNTTLR